MSEKEITSVNLDRENAEYLREQDHSVSQIINRWVTEYRQHQRIDMDEERAERALAELAAARESLREAVDHAETAFDTIEDAITDSTVDARDPDSELAARIDEIHDQLTTDSQWVDDPRDPENLAIQNHAENLGLPPTALARELRRRDDTVTTGDTPSPPRNEND